MEPGYEWASILPSYVSILPVFSCSRSSGLNSPWNPEPGFHVPGKAGGDSILGVEQAGNYNTQKSTYPRPTMFQLLRSAK